MSETAASTDEELVRETLLDQERFGALIDRYEGKLRRYVARISDVSPAELDDILQETFIKVYQNLNGFDARFPFSSWIYRIARNTAISHFRKRKTRAEEPLPEVPDVNEAFTADVDIEASLAQAESNQAIVAGLAKLPDDYRELLVLRYFEDKSYDEMSDILMKPPGTIASNLNRAKAKLRTIITPDL